jgi:hypothetical protein
MAKSRAKSEIIMQELNDKRADQISRDDIARLLKSIGKPGERTNDKIKLVSQLNLPTNNQDHAAEQSLHSYKEF